jgi:hypothetical protein
MRAGQYSGTRHKNGKSARSIFVTDFLVTDSVRVRLPSNGPRADLGRCAVCASLVAPASPHPMHSASTAEGNLCLSSERPLAHRRRYSLPIRSVNVTAKDDALRGEIEHAHTSATRAFAITVKTTLRFRPGRLRDARYAPTGRVLEAPIVSAGVSGGAFHPHSVVGIKFNNVLYFVSFCDLSSASPTPFGTQTRLTEFALTCHAPNCSCASA